MEKELTELLERCRNNERKAQFVFYNKWFPFLMRVVRKYRKNEDDAAALVNETFLKIFNNLDKYNPAAPFELWIRRIAINTVTDEFRKNRKMDETIIYAEAESKESVLNLAETGMDANAILGLLNRLGEEERTVFNLFEIDGYSHAEIAGMTGVSERTSKRYLAAAREGLKTMIQKQNKKEQAVINPPAPDMYLLI